MEWLLFVGNTNAKQRKMAFIKIPKKVKKAILLIALIVAGGKLLYKIGGESYLGAKVNTLIAEEITDYIIKDIPSLKFNGKIFNSNTSTINFTSTETDKNKLSDIRDKVDKRACYIVKNNEINLKSLNVNIHASRNKKLIYNKIYSVNNCI